MDLPDLNNEPMTPTPQNTIRAVCVEIDGQSGWETWPSRFVFPPRVGDTVKSGSGRVAKIANVMHIMGAGGFPVVVLELSRNTGESTPVEGANAQLE